MIDSSGKLLHCSSPEHWDQAFVTGPIPLDQRRSLYSRWGDVPLLLVLTIVILESILQDRFAKSKMPPGSNHATVSQGIYAR